MENHWVCKSLLIARISSNCQAFLEVLCLLMLIMLFQGFFFLTDPFHIYYSFWFSINGMLNSEAITMNLMKIPQRVANETFTFPGSLYRISVFANVYVCIYIFFLSFYFDSCSYFLFRLVLVCIFNFILKLHPNDTGKERV